MDTVVHPGSVTGEVTPPPSKSETHRALLASALGGGGSVANPLDSRDTRATAAAITALGGAVTWSADSADIAGFDAGLPRPAADPIDCANSGTTLRLVTGVAALADGTTRLTGDASLRRRPNGPLLDAIADLGASATSEDDDGTAPLTVTGPLAGGETTMSGSTSSQFVSSVLLAGAHTPAGVSVSLSSALRSAPYLELTLKTLEAFGAEVTRSDRRFAVAGGRRLSTPDGGVTVGVDPSAASYPLAAGVLAGDPSLTVTDVGERAGAIAPIVSVLEAFDIDLDRRGRVVTVSQATPAPATVDLGDCPDLLPTAAVLAAVADGTSELVNCAHARHKETDRLHVTAEAMRALGVSVTENEDGLTIQGRPGGLTGGTIDPHDDHRIAMAGAVAGLAADGPVRIQDADCVAVSYPRFFEDLQAIGVQIEPTN